MLLTEPMTIALAAATDSSKVWSGCTICAWIRCGASFE